MASLNHEKSCALMFYPHLAGVCHHSEEDITPFGTGRLLQLVFLSYFLLGWVDFLVVFHFHLEISRSRIFDYKSYSFFWVEWPETDQKLPGKIVLSIGMGIVVLLSIPLGYYNLDDNVVVQNAALVVILISCLGIRKQKTSHHGRSTIRE